LRRPTAAPQRGRYSHFHDSGRFSPVRWLTQSFLSGCGLEAGLPEGRYVEVYRTFEGITNVSRSLARLRRAKLKIDWRPWLLREFMRKTGLACYLISGGFRPGADIGALS